MRALQLEVCCLVRVFVQCLFAPVYEHSHAYRPVCEHSAVQFLPHLDVRFSLLFFGLLLRKNQRGLAAFTLSSHSDKKRLLYIAKRLTTFFPARAIKSSRCCFWGSYLLNPLHSNAPVGGGEHPKI